MNHHFTYKKWLNIIGCILIHLALSAQELVDITTSMGITQYPSEQNFGTGVSCFDMNQDGWLDLHVSTAFGVRDLIYKNTNGQGFVEVSNDLGLDLTGGSIASIWMDYNGDWLVDLLVMNSCNEVDSCEGKNLQLFRQEMNGTFTEVTEEAGLDIFSNEHLNMVKGGLAAGDINLDGYLDIFLTHWGNGQIFVFINDGSGHFTEAGAEL